MLVVPGQSFTLKDETKFIRVIAGKVEVYAATKFSNAQKDEKTFFRQMFLTEINAGEAAYPALDEFEQIEIVLKATEKSEVELLDFDVVMPQMQVSLMRRWFLCLSEFPSIKFLADKGDEDLTTWRNGTLFQGKETSAEIYREFAANETTLSMLLGTGFASEDKRFLQQMLYS